MQRLKKLIEEAKVPKIKKDIIAKIASDNDISVEKANNILNCFISRRFYETTERVTQKDKRGGRFDEG